MQTEHTSPLNYALPWKRLAAFAIDVGISLIVAIPLAFVLRSSNIEYTEMNKARIDGIGYVIWWAYFTLMEISGYQGTIGKIVLGLKVTDLAGQPIGFWQSTGRHFGKWLTVFSLGIGILIAFFTKKRQCLHDMASGCLVLDKVQIKSTPESTVSQWVFRATVTGHSGGS